MTTIYAQGDLLFLPVNDIPANAKPAPDLVLALGEVTGHSHRAIGPQVARFLVDEGGGGASYLLIRERPAEIVHEEHHTVTLAPGAWLVRRQVEYPIGDAHYRAVAD